MQPVLYISLFLAAAGIELAAARPSHYRINQNHGREMAIYHVNQNHGRESSAGHDMHQNHGRRMAPSFAQDLDQEDLDDEAEHATFLAIINHYLATGGSEGLLDSLSRLVAHSASTSVSWRSFGTSDSN